MIGFSSIIFDDQIQQEETTTPEEETTIPDSEVTDPDEETTPDTETTVPDDENSESGVEPDEPTEEPTVPGEEPTVPDEEPTVPDEEPSEPEEEPTEPEVSKPLQDNDVVANLYVFYDKSDIHGFGHTWIYVENLTNQELKVGIYPLPAYEGVSVGTLPEYDGWGLYYNIEAYQQAIYGMEGQVSMYT